MSFLLPCPNCGPRGVYEFRYGGEANPRPAGAPSERWAEYLYLRTNAAGVQEEWWFHRMGCQRWFKARRDTARNAVERTYWARGGAGEPEEQAVQGQSVEP